MQRQEVISERLGEIWDFLRPLEPDGDQVPVPPELPDGRTVSVPERGEMFLRDSGPQPGEPTVVLLHGWTLSADLNWFTGGYEMARRHGRVMAPDLRGHGRGPRSDKPFTLDAAADDVAGLIDHLGLGPVVLVGYSMGGSVALLTWRRHRHTVAGMVLVSTALQWRATLRERALWAAMGSVEYVLRFGAPSGITDRYLRKTAQTSAHLSTLKGWLKAEVRRGDPVDIAAAARGLSAFDARSFVGGVDVPTAVVVTSHDRIIRPAKQRELAAAISGAHTVELDGFHNAWMLRPDAFTEALDQALRLVVGATG